MLLHDLLAYYEMGHGHSYLNLDRVEVSLVFASFQLLPKFEGLF